MKPLLCLLLLTGCAQTRLYEHGQLVAVIQGDATNVTVDSGSFHFHADTLNHSSATTATYAGATGLVGGLGGAIASAALGLKVTP